MARGDAGPTRQIFPPWAGISFRSGGLKAGLVEARPDGKAKFFRAGTAGGWRKALSERQAAPLNAPWYETHRASATRHRARVETRTRTRDCWRGRPQIAQCEARASVILSPLFTVGMWKKPDRTTHPPIGFPEPSAGIA